MAGNHRRKGPAAATGLLCLLLTLYSAAAERRTADGGGSHPWLAAIGRLAVPGDRYTGGQRRQFVEDCSATLVTRRRGLPADTIITAWHCLENYRDLSKPIVFTLPTSDGPLVREAYRLADGGGMHADWAILRLYGAVPAGRADALIIHPHRPDPNLPIAMAGFSRDGDSRGEDRWLSFDPDCSITTWDPRSADTDCSAGKGASGGAVVQLFGEGEAGLCGVISEGDGVGYSRFVTIDSFRSTVARYLRAP